MMPPEKFIETLKRLSVEDKPRRVPFPAQIPPYRLRELRRGEVSAHPADDRQTDYRLEGLDLFLSALTSVQSSSVANHVKILWEFLCVYAPKARSEWHPPDVFDGDYLWHRRGERHSPFEAHFVVQLCEASWLPSKDGSLHKPSDLSLFDLPEGFERNETLEKILKMRPREVDSLANKLNLPRDFIEFLSKNPDRAKEIWKQIGPKDETKEQVETASTDGKTTPTHTDSKPDKPERGHPPKRSDAPSEHSRERHPGHREGIEGSSEEGSEHRKLKDFLAKNPQILEEGLKLNGIEYPLKSGDRCDLVFVDAAEKFVAVEVEAKIDPRSEMGMWQAIKYAHQIAAENKLSCDQVRSILVAPRIPDDIKQECQTHGVEAIEVEGKLPAGWAD